jgi:glycine cleavage system aminomethyltransferase T
MAGTIPQPGRIALNPMLAESGKIVGDFTVAAVEREFMLTRQLRRPGLAHALVRQHRGGRVHVENVSDARTGFPSQPNARELLKRVTADVDRSVHGLPPHDRRHGDCSSTCELHRRTSASRSSATHVGPAPLNASSGPRPGPRHRAFASRPC